MPNKNPAKDPEKSYSSPLNQLNVSLTLAEMRVIDTLAGTYGLKPARIARGLFRLGLEQLDLKKASDILLLVAKGSTDFDKSHLENL